jgi:hypothetical protein
LEEEFDKSSLTTTRTNVNQWHDIFNFKVHPVIVNVGKYSIVNVAYMRIWANTV